MNFVPQFVDLIVATLYGVAQLLNLVMQRERVQLTLIRMLTVALRYRPPSGGIVVVSEENKRSFANLFDDFPH